MENKQTVINAIVALTGALDAVHRTSNTQAAEQITKKIIKLTEQL